MPPLFVGRHLSALSLRFRDLLLILLLLLLQQHLLLLRNLVLRPNRIGENACFQLLSGVELPQLLSPLLICDETSDEGGQCNKDSNPKRKENNMGDDY